jgi:hypothetical protein
MVYSIEATMKIIIMSLLLVSSAFAKEYKEFHEEPNALFDTKKNFAKMVVVTWETTKNVQKRCDEESKSRGLSGFDYEVEACSFWGTRFGVNVCHIITEKKTTLATIGHEMRHCYQGSWHK